MKMLSFLSITSLLVMVMACKTTVDTTSTTKAEIDAKETVVTCTNGGERGNEHYTEVYKNPAIYARAYEDNRICEPVMFSQGETYKRFLDYCYDEQASRNIKHTIKLMKRRFGQVGCDEAYEGLKKTKSLAFNTDDDIRDLRPLAEFKNLETLDLSNNGNLFHLEPISGLTSLTTLYINWTGVANITPLANLTGLKKLFLSYNNVSDISPLANFTKLEELYLSNNKIEDLTPIAGLSDLTFLSLDKNEIKNLTPLAGLSKLKTLGLHGNNITKNEENCPTQNVPEVLSSFCSGGGGSDR